MFEIILAYAALLVVLIILLLVLPVIGNTRKKSFLSVSRQNQDLTFPEGFLWGTATASQQIEHLQKTDWSAFVEKSLFEKNFKSDDKGEPLPGHILGIDNFSENVVRKTANFDEMYADDLKAAAEMGHNSFRFSFCWARLFPTPGMESPSEEGVAFYQRILESMEQNQLKPSATLFHFSSPDWFWEADEQGKRGWERGDALELFEVYTRAVIKHFGSQIDHWCTLNEPMVFAYMGYMGGLFPPNEKRARPEDITEVVATLIRAHALAYRLLKRDAQENNREIQVGYTKHIRLFEPYRNYSLLDRLTAAKVEKAFLWDWMDAVHTGKLRISGSRKVVDLPEARGTMDYLGINYYGRFYIKSNLFAPTEFEIIQGDQADPREKINELGWAMYPLGFRKNLLDVHKRYGLPIYILENGAADSAEDDRSRQELLFTHLRELGLSIQEDGLDIRGYYHWALTDNFEWAEGFNARFGLMGVDYENGFRRFLRPSAKIYSEIIRSGISQERWKKAVTEYNIIS